MPASLLEGATLVPRRGGERFQADALGIPRSLKKCFQAARVACDDRHGPLVVAGGLLVFVPGLGIDARAVARCGDDRLTLSWQPGG